MATRHPANHIEWRKAESSNVMAVGWDNADNMYVLFKGGRLYLYAGVTRQRCVAAAQAESVGKYVISEIIPKFTGVKIEAPIPVLV